MFTPMLKKLHHNPVVLYVFIINRGEFYTLDLILTDVCCDMCVTAWLMTYPHMRYILCLTTLMLCVFWGNFQVACFLAAGNIFNSTKCTIYWWTILEGGFYLWITVENNWYVDTIVIIFLHNSKKKKSYLYVSITSSIVNFNHVVC